jgi:hypothetical protein
MTYFSIFSSDANLVESFDQEDEALAALEQIAREDPENADEYAMLTFDEFGNAIGEAVVGSEARWRSSHAAPA